MASVHALDLAHMLEIHYPNREITTSTEAVIDEKDSEMSLRNVSAIHIKLTS